MGFGATITGVGAYAPPGILTNEDFEKLVDTSDEWIVQRTGMKRRHIAAPHQATSDVAVPAALAALDAAGRKPADVDCVIVATATPDHLFPATACLVSSRLGIEGKAAFDISIACSGFVYALTLAASLIRSGLYNTVLVLGAETLSKLVDYTDRTTCVLFGDGAGAVVLRAAPHEGMLRVEVHDRGRWRPERTHNTGGCGLDLIRALADEVDIVTTPAGTTVTFAVPLPTKAAGVPGA